MKTLSLLIIVILCVSLVKSFSIASVYNGKAITPEIEFNITDLLKKASVMSGSDIQKNIVFLKTNLVNMYHGKWNIIINTLEHLYSNMNYSMNGEWWLHWYGKNSYYPTWIYGMQRVAETYDSRDQFSAILHCETKFGNGFSVGQKMFILNSFGIDHSVEELNNVLNENITKGNWNILRNDRYQALFHVSVFAKNNKWFTYCTFDSFYFVYLS